MTHPAKISTSNANRYARYGLSLPMQTLRALEKRGIHCQPSVSIEHQHLARHDVLRGFESGGAVVDMGRYCAYFDADGNPAPWLQQIDSISGNGRHAIVIAPELVRISMFQLSALYFNLLRNSAHIKRSSSFRIASDHSRGWTALSFSIRAELSLLAHIRSCMRSQRSTAPCSTRRFRT